MKKLVVATGNRHKTEEIRAMLGAGYAVSDLQSYPELPAVEETGSTFLENATLKAVEISQQVAGLVLSDDSGLEVDALGGAPGVYSARYAGEDGNDAANNAKLLSELDGERCRTARFRCVMVLAEKGEVLAHFDGAVDGSIINQQQGTAGFGYDPLFVPDGHDQTFAQLGDEIKNGLSHRARAMEKVVPWLMSHV
ncbi:MAG: RdgB/HAM1 family non-canonical purine NTP pyrophosphatase [Verrucomicrobiae bacterium]|nr:RdgB/HAM1 family non-canonical purine NTP pyrophosphatase [Verrucomicrobiae bacterium]NNJ42935.1 RdgB/HAM1 family non-canonical purine NTP pyrophosphatase [Akkermansiaceae bacterium]